MVVLAWLLACQPSPTDDPGSSTSLDPGPPESTPKEPSTTPKPSHDEGLSIEALYTRASLDVRGRRPSLDELEALGADPEALPSMLDALVDDDAAPGRIADWFAPRFRTRVDYFEYFYEPLPVRAVGEEPMNLVATLAMNDLSYREIVRADFTVVDPLLFDVWPLELVSSPLMTPEGTVVASYADERPSAGLLSTNAMWWRHTSTLENANRGRANAISQAFLCESFLDRPIVFPSDIDLSDAEAIENALRTQPACTACHASLDPLAGFLWGFMVSGDGVLAASTYAPERELDWMQYGVPPAFFGTPGDTLTDLGYAISNDERFAMCAVKTVYEGLLGRPLSQEDDGALADHREVFLQSDLNLKALTRSILDSPAYAGRSALAGFGGRPEAVAMKTVSPEVLADSLWALTGYRVKMSGRDVLETDEGLRAVVGGSDRGASWLPSTGMALTQRRLGEGAAHALFEGEGAGSALGKLVDELDTEISPDGEVIGKLTATIYSRLPSDEEVEAYQELWSELAELEGPEEAWVGIVAAMLADPSFTLY